MSHFVRTIKGIRVQTVVFCVLMLFVTNMKAQTLFCTTKAESSPTEAVKLRVEGFKILGWHDSVTPADDFTPPNNCHMTYIIPEKCRSCTLAWIIFSECNKQNLFFQLSCPFLVDKTKPYFHYLQSSL